jgi:hypothetical protein
MDTTHTMKLELWNGENRLSVVSPLGPDTSDFAPDNRKMDLIFSRADSLSLFLFELFDIVDKATLH